MFNNRTQYPLVSFQIPVVRSDEERHEESHDNFKSVTDFEVATFCSPKKPFAPVANTQKFSNHDDHEQSPANSTADLQTNKPS